MAGTVIAPYAQVAAVVNKDGTVVRSKGVVEIKRTGAGRYSITVSDDIALDKSVPIVSLRQDADWGSEIYTRVPNGADVDLTFSVLTGVNGTATDEPFHVIVP
ncbi:hypothetical protein ACWDQO_16715 [Streptomyces sp. NPDC003703]|uniref:hypothetical protein n=1 Tax=Streptomyces sp. NPDC003283 TaxID=3364681 RepID=UPI0036CA7393